MAESPARLDFKAPEGEYRYHSERPSRAGFSASRPCRLTLAQLPGEGGGPGAAFVIFNSLEFLYITELAHPEREPVRSLYCGTSGNGPNTWPTCHVHAPAPDGVDLLIGLNTGDVLATSLAGQVAAARGDQRRSAALHFNVSGVAEGSRATGLAWLDSEKGTFAVGHASGALYVYQKKGATAQDGGRITTALRYIVSLHGAEPFASLRTGSPVNAVAASPDGASVAVACADGALRVYDTASRRLTGGFRSYYGGLLAAAWSPDGGHIATGGEDDLVCVYCCAGGGVVAWGSGHASWVSAVAFDPRAHGEQQGGAAAASGPVRLLSGGHDGQLALWDFDLSPEATTPVRHDSPAGRSSSQAEGAIAPSAPHAEMDLQPPVRIRKLHAEPISSVLPAAGALFVASHSGAVRCWQSPSQPQQPQGEEAQAMEEGDAGALAE